MVPGTHAEVHCVGLGDNRDLSDALEQLARVVRDAMSPNTSGYRPKSPPVQP